MPITAIEAGAQGLFTAKPCWGQMASADLLLYVHMHTHTPVIFVR